LGRNWWVGIGSEKKGKRLANQTKVKGLVEVLGDFPSKGPWGNGTEIHSGAVLKTEEGKITVHLGRYGISWNRLAPSKPETNWKW
jgi:hypothetical protein